MGAASGGSERTSITKGLSTLVATSFIQSKSECMVKADTTQQINIKCNPTAGGGTTFEGRAPCVKCFENVRAQQKERYETYEAQWAAKGKVFNFPSYDDDMGRWMDQLNDCLTSCKACIFTDLSIAAVYEWKQDCSIDTETMRSFRQNISSNVNQALTNNQDVLSSVAGMLGAGDKDTVVNNITNRVNSRVGITFLNKMHEHLRGSQTMSFESGDGGSTFSGIHVETSVKGLAQFVADQGVTQNLFSNTEWQAYSHVANKENTIGDAGDVVKKAIGGLADASKSILGQVLLAVVGVLLFVFVALTSLGWYRYAQKRRGA